MKFRKTVGICVRSVEEGRANCELLLMLCKNKYVDVYCWSLLSCVAGVASFFWLNEWKTIQSWNIETETKEEQWNVLSVLSKYCTNAGRKKNETSFAFVIIKRETLYLLFTPIYIEKQIIYRTASWLCRSVAVSHCNIHRGWKHIL